MNDLLASLAHAVASRELVVAILCALCSYGARSLIAKAQKDDRLANLADIIKIADQALEAAIQAGGAGDLTRQQVLQRALVAAKKVLVANRPDLVAAAEADVETLIHGRQSLQLAPGGAVVNLPSPVPQGAA